MADKVIQKFESESDSLTKQRLQNLLQSEVTLQNEIKKDSTDVESLKNICNKLHTNGSENTRKTTYTKRQEKHYKCISYPLLRKHLINHN